MKLEDVRLGTNPRTGEVHLIESGDLPEKYIRFERRKIKRGEEYLVNERNMPTGELVEFPKGMTEKIVQIYVGYGPNGSDVETLYRDHEELPVSKIHWES